MGFVEVVNVDKANGRQRAPVFLQTLVYNQILIVDFSFKIQQDKKEQLLSSHRLHFYHNRTKSTVQQHLLAFVSGCHGGLISCHPVVST